jgi:hypothetical protein
MSKNVTYQCRRVRREDAERFAEEPELARFLRMRSASSRRAV